MADLHNFEAPRRRTEDRDTKQKEHALQRNGSTDEKVARAFVREALDSPGRDHRLIDTVIHGARKQEQQGHSGHRFLNVQAIERRESGRTRSFDAGNARC